MIAIIDYGVGNIKAFSNIFKNLNIPYIVAKSCTDLKDITKLILPGVGSYDHAMQSLQNSGMRKRLDELVLKKRIPIIGICVGMQMLAKSSDEGTLPGLGWINGTVKKFDNSQPKNKLPCPHMGWNSIEIIKDNKLFNQLETKKYFYFLHSYYFYCNDNKDTIATTNYGIDFDSVVNHNNIYGVQCHPEKSHQNGMTLLKNFGEL